MKRASERPVEESGEVPVAFPGTRLKLHWPLTDGSTGEFSATISEVRKAKPRRTKQQRRPTSGFRYLLRWEDGTPPLWSRLRHLTYSLDPHFKTLPWSHDCQDADHAETPLVAYQHIAVLLERVARSIGKRPSRLRIYDPYYCAASVSGHLATLGYYNVYNQPADFYAAIAEGTLPDFDVLVTNPPYSGDHVDRLLQFVRGIAQPSFLLIPNYFLETAAFRTLQRAIGASGRCVCTAAGGEAHGFLVGPRKRYSYRSPKELRPAVRNKARKCAAYHCAA